MAQFTEEEKMLRRIDKRFSKGVVEYGLIEDGDKILIGLSGGKDSLALVELLARRVRVYKPRFSVVAVHVVMKKFDMTIIRPMCLVHEADLMELAQVRGYRKQVKNCPYESQSSRSAMKGILKQLEEMNPEARYSLWGSMTNVQEELLPAIINH